ncbi:LysR family transcriptional regulator [Alkalicoccobacillus porphyridii]|nr:LysR family transcriptional regulator [Alkalicoccobacillus porphyridii]
MNLNFIETFLVVVKKKSLSAAAKELHVAQTTISQRLMIAETELGFKLIERGKGIKKVNLTPAGEEFLKLAEQWDNIDKEFNLLKQRGPKLALSIGSIDSFNTFFLPDVYKEITTLTSSLFLSANTLHSTEIYDDIESRSIDIGFSLIDRNSPNVAVNQFFESPLVVISAKEYVGVNSVKINELDSKFELFMPWGEEYRLWHEYWCGQMIYQQFKLDNLSILLAVLENSKYWAVVPEWIAKKVIKERNIYIYKLQDSPPPYTCYKLTHKKPFSSKRNALELFQYLTDKVLEEENTKSPV